MEGHNKPATQSSAAVYPHGAVVTIVLSFVAIFGIAALGVTALQISALYAPRLPELRVGAFSVSNFTSTNGSRVSFVAEIRLIARNPSGKVSISYDHIVAGMYYKWMLLSQSTLAPFSQEANNKTSLVAKLAADGSVVEKWVIDGINGDIGQNGSVEFDFKLTSWVHWEYNWWSGSRKDVLEVFCGELTVEIPSNGRSGGLIGPPGHCRVREGADE